MRVLIFILFLLSACATNEWVSVNRNLTNGTYDFTLKDPKFVKAKDPREMMMVWVRGINDKTLSTRFVKSFPVTDHFSVPMSVINSDFEFLIKVPGKPNIEYTGKVRR